MPVLLRNDVSRLPVMLGLSGLLPFVAATLAAWWAPLTWQAPVVTAFLYYSAVILSFLGGIH